MNEASGDLFSNTQYNHEDDNQVINKHFRTIDDEVVMSESPDLPAETFRKPKLRPFALKTIDPLGF